MMRIVAKSKLHGLWITETNLDYSGSLTLDTHLLAATGILPRAVHVDERNRVQQ